MPVEYVRTSRPVFKKPSRILVTAGMPYANGRIHLGHMAGAHVPADIAARYWRQVIGPKNVLFICGSDDHGSTAEMAARKAKTPVKDFVSQVHAQQSSTFARYQMSFSGGYAGTSHPDYHETHRNRCQDFFRRFHDHKLLVERTSERSFDPVNNRFLMDRQIIGKCPNPRCTNEQAFGNECNDCGSQHEPEDLIDPRSAFDGVTKPIRKATTHWHLDIDAMAEPIQSWLQRKKQEKEWRQIAFSDALQLIAPSLILGETARPLYENVRGTLPKHTFVTAKAKRFILKFDTKANLALAQIALSTAGITAELNNAALIRGITRDEPWGIPLPLCSPGMANKSLYVWPESLLAPISFSEVALQKLGGAEADGYQQFWHDPQAKVIQLIGQDNTYFYTLMQAAMWLGSRKNFMELPGPGDLQLTDVVVNHHLLINGKKMSKSSGNFHTADELLDERFYFDGQHYTPDQVRYSLAHIGLGDEQASFSFGGGEGQAAAGGATHKDKGMNAHCDMLGGRINGAIERPISAVHSDNGGFNHKVPQGKLIDDVESATATMIDAYHKKMQKQNYAALLFELENYARIINALFTKYRPHDNRVDESKRADALYSSFYVLRNLMIMLQPFTPETMERVRQSLNLPETVFNMEELGKPMDVGHSIGQQLTYFPSRPREADAPAE